MAAKLMNEGPKWIFVIVWLAANFAVFGTTFNTFWNDEQFYYTRVIIGLSLPFAKASAGGINLNSMLILLPVCRNLLSFVRGSFLCRCCKRNVRRQLDKNLSFHKLCAYMICFWTIIHYAAHTFNFERYWLAYNTPGLQAALSNLGSTTDNGTWINPIRTPVTNPMLELIKNVAGFTGVIITLPLILIVSSASEFIRRSYFEVFWFTHHLFILYYIGMVTHGLGNVVKGQTNVVEHNPEFCRDKYMQWGSPAVPECPIPQFAGDGAQTWKWVLAPLVLYLIERLVRFIRSRQKVTISKVVSHPSKVLELQMQKNGWSMEAGQYIFINCPSISRLEWHPFTLTSAPLDDHFSVHIRLAGDWTNGLAQACHMDQKDFQDPSRLPQVSVDGPFGTCSEDVFRYQTVMLVGAGIGVTPFASILKDIWYRSLQPANDMKVRKVYFFWICPDTNAFEWFTDLLVSMEEQMEQAGNADFLDINIYLTRGWTSPVAWNLTTREHEERDPITGLRQKTNYGRPVWDQIFASLAQTHSGVRTGVFFCGPKVLSSTLHKLSNQYSGKDGTHFVYNKENF